MSELIDPLHARRDLRQLETAVKKGFKIPDALYDQMASIMGQILAKGNNREKTAAARVIVAIAEFNESLNPPTPPQTQTTINVGVNVANIADTGRDPLLAIAERIAAGGVSSANSIAPIAISNPAAEGITTAPANSKRISSAGKRAPRKSTRNRRDTTSK